MRASGHRVGLLALGTAMILFVTSCDHAPVGAHAFSASPCKLPPVPSSFDGTAVAAGALQVALADAATRSRAGLENRSHTDDLVQALGYLADQLVRGANDANCRMLGLAVDALSTQDGVVEGPDRTSIELVLNLTTAALRAQP